MKNLLKKLACEDRGQDLVEYALLAAGIGIFLIPTIPAVGEALEDVYDNIAQEITEIGGGN